MIDATPHPWLYRFGFSGAAETLWVLPPGVEHSDSSYEPLPWPFACAELRRWALDSALLGKLCDLHESAFGTPLVPDPARTFDRQVGALVEAMREGRLVVWGLRMASGQLPASIA